MLISRRARDVLRSPGRLWAAGRRAWHVAASGEALATWRRLRPRGPTAQEYRDFLLRVPATDPGAARPRQVVRLGEAAADAQAGADALDARARFVVIVDRPTVAASQAVAALSSAMTAMPGAVAAYCDHDHFDTQGRRERPVLQSCWDPLQVRSAEYCGAALAVREDAWKRLEARVDGVADALAALAEARERNVAHVPGVFYHLQRELPHLPPLPDDRSSMDAWIIIPTKDRVDLLARCVQSIPAQLGDRRVGVVLVDNGTTEAGFDALCDGIRTRMQLRVVRAPGAFNFSRLCNAGAAQAGDGVLVFLNNDAYFPDATDLWEIVATASQPGFGAVAPRLDYENGRVQSAGVLVGVNRVATSALAGYDPGDPTVAAWCASPRRVRAVMGACLAVSATRFAEVRGFDEELAVALNDVDLGLRLEAAGYVNAFTPRARAVHVEGASRGFEVTPDERRVLDEAESLFRARWPQLLDAVDPAHHPWLSRTGNPFAFARDPVASAPRLGWPAC
jgi:GT2 family glycosyltransferase